MNPSQLLGKSTEMLIASKLLAENREVYLPCVDDHGVDIIVRTRDFDKSLPDTDPRSYEFQEIQVKSVSTGGLFAAIKCESHPNYWFVFYIKELDCMWLFNSIDFCNKASQNSKGKNIGKYSLDLKPTKRTPAKQSHFLITNFSKLP